MAWTWFSRVGGFVAISETARLHQSQWTMRHWRAKPSMIDRIPCYDPSCWQRRGPMTSGLLVKTAAPINLQISDVERVTTAMSRLSWSSYCVNLCSNTAISFEWHRCWLTNSFQALPLFLCISDPFLFFGLCTAPAIWRKNTPPYVFDVQMILTMLLIMELHGTKSSRPTPWPWQV